MIKGIDISHWQGDIDFNKVKADGYDFVILKAGGWERTLYKDPMFETYYKDAKAAGLYVGAYYFAGRYFYEESVSVNCAYHFKDILGDKTFEYPVFIDIEAQDNRYKDGITKAAIAFCRQMEDFGYFAGIYASDISGFKNRLNIEEIQAFVFWVARYGMEPTYCKNYKLWQYASKGSVNGICGSVDLDISYYDFSKVMKDKGLNGFKKIKKQKKSKEE